MTFPAPLGDIRFVLRNVGPAEPSPRRLEAPARQVVAAGIRPGIGRHRDPC